jgi:hypothetical protein
MSKAFLVLLVSLLPLAAWSQERPLIETEQAAKDHAVLACEVASKGVFKVPPASSWRVTRSGDEWSASALDPTDGVPWTVTVGKDRGVKKPCLHILIEANPSQPARF